MGPNYRCRLGQALHLRDPAFHGTAEIVGSHSVPELPSATSIDPASAVRPCPHLGHLRRREHPIGHHLAAAQVAKKNQKNRIRDKEIGTHTIFAAAGWVEDCARNLSPLARAARIVPPSASPGAQARAGRLEGAGSASDRRPYSATAERCCSSRRLVGRHPEKRAGATVQNGCAAALQRQPSVGGPPPSCVCGAARPHPDLGHPEQ